MYDSTQQKEKTNLYIFLLVSQVLRRKERIDIKGGLTDKRTNYSMKTSNYDGKASLYYMSKKLPFCVLYIYRLSDRQPISFSVNSHIRTSTGFRWKSGD